MRAQQILALSFVSKHDTALEHASWVSDLLFLFPMIYQQPTLSAVYSNPMHKLRVLPINHSPPTIFRFHTLACNSLHPPFLGSCSQSTFLVLCAPHCTFPLLPLIYIDSNFETAKNFRLPLQHRKKLATAVACITAHPYFFCLTWRRHSFMSTAAKAIS